MSAFMVPLINLSPSFSLFLSVLLCKRNCFFWMHSNTVFKYLPREVFYYLRFILLYKLICISSFVHSGNKQIESSKQREYLGNSRKLKRDLVGQNKVTKWNTSYFLLKMRILWLYRSKISSFLFFKAGLKKSCSPN